MAKTNKPSTKLPSLANPCGAEERLRRLCQDNNEDEATCFPVTESMVQDMAIEIINWAEEEDSIILNDFYNPRGYTADKLQRWANKYPVFGAAYKYAKDMIGARREKRRILETHCSFTLSEYSSIWKEKEERLHKRKIELATIKQDKAEATTINVFAKPAENCPEVPYAPAEIEVDQS